MLTVGSLFSGIGGLDLAMETVTAGRLLWLSETSKFCRGVLARRWPGVHCYQDVRNIDGRAARPDLICGGFPCQDVSTAGTRAGLAGDRSGLWWEMHRIIGVLAPRFVFVENVAGLFTRGLGDVLGSLSALGFDAEWSTLRAADIGAPHLRRRVFILAVQSGLSNAERGGLRQLGQWHRKQHRISGAAVALDDGETGPMADTDSGGLQGIGQPESRGEQRARGDEPDGRSERWAGGSPWKTEPAVGRVAHGVSSRVDRLRALGNAVVPLQAAYAFSLLADRATT